MDQFKSSTRCKLLFLSVLVLFFAWAQSGYGANIKGRTKVKTVSHHPSSSRLNEIVGHFKLRMKAEVGSRYTLIRLNMDIRKIPQYRNLVNFIRTKSPENISGAHSGNTKNYELGIKLLDLTERKESSDEISVDGALFLRSDGKIVYAYAKQSYSENMKSMNSEVNYSVTDAKYYKSSHPLRHLPGNRPFYGWDYETSDSLDYDFMVREELTGAILRDALDRAATKMTHGSLEVSIIERRKL